MLDMDYVFYYLRKEGFKIKSLAHLGANYAQGRNLYVSNGIDKILWVEAIPSIVDTLKQNLSNVSDLVLQGVLSKASGEKVNFKIASNNSMSSSIYEFKHHVDQYPNIEMIDKISLTTTTLDDLMKENSITFDYDVAVLDLQGSDLNALRGASCLLQRSIAVAVEVSCIELYENAPLEAEVDAFMHEQGFRKELSAYTQYGWGEALYVKRAAAC